MKILKKSSAEAAYDPTDLFDLCVDLTPHSQFKFQKSNFCISRGLGSSGGNIDVNNENCIRRHDHFCVTAPDTLVSRSS